MVAGEAIHLTPVLLLELVAVHRVVEKEGEVRKEVQPIVEEIAMDMGRAVRGAPSPLPGGAVAMGVAAVALIQSTEAPDEAAVHGAARYLIGGVPVPAVAHGGQIETIEGVAPAVAQHPVVAAVLVGMVPWTVVVEDLEGAEHLPGRERGRAGHEAAIVVVAAAGELDQGARERVRIVDVGRAGRREIPLVGIVRPLAVIDAADDLRDHEIQIGVALAVAVGGKIHRDPGDRGREVGAMVEVESPKEKLVGLAGPRVLGDDHPRHGLQDLAGAQQRARLDLLGSHPAFGGRVADPDEGIVALGDLDGRELNGLVCTGGGQRNEAQDRQADCQPQREAPTLHQGALVVALNTKCSCSVVHE